MYVCIGIWSQVQTCNSSISTVISGGLQDFEEFEETVTFDPSPGRESRNIVIELVDDEIDEPEEGFLVVFTVTSGVPEDLANLQVLRNVTLAVITDNDRKL